MSNINQSELILGIETATRAGSVALMRGDEVLGALEGDPTGTATTQLLAQIRELLAASGLALSDIGRIAVAIGPGSFTGLRIGLATVKGLAATLGCVVDAVPTLHAVAVSANPQGPVTALMPAGRGEVFAQHLIYSNRTLGELGPPEHLPLTDILEGKRGCPGWTWAGVAAEDLDVVQEFAAGEREARVVPAAVNLATSVIRVAQAGGRETTPGALTAMYVRLSDAELKFRCQP